MNEIIKTLNDLETRVHDLQKLYPDTKECDLYLNLIKEIRTKTEMNQRKSDFELIKDMVVRQIEQRRNSDNNYFKIYNIIYEPNSFNIFFEIILNQNDSGMSIGIGRTGSENEIYLSVGTKYNINCPTVDFLKCGPNRRSCNFTNILNITEEYSVYNYKYLIEATECIDMTPLNFIKEIQFIINCYAKNLGEGNLLENIKLKKPIIVTETGIFSGHDLEEIPIVEDIPVCTQLLKCVVDLTPLPVSEPYITINEDGNECETEDEETDDDMPELESPGFGVPQGGYGKGGFEITSVLF